LNKKGDNGAEVAVADIQGAKHDAGAQGCHECQQQEINAGNRPWKSSLHFRQGIRCSLRERW
jgi:hypothetical protein